MISKTEFAEHKSEWAMRLGVYNLSYEPEEAVKSHVLAEFVANSSPMLEA